MHHEKNVANILHSKQSSHFGFIVYIIKFLLDLSRYFTATAQIWNIRENMVGEMLRLVNKQTLNNQTNDKMLQLSVSCFCRNIWTSRLIESPVIKISFTPSGWRETVKLWKKYYFSLVFRQMNKNTGTSPVICGSLKPWLQRRVAENNWEETMSAAVLLF